MYAAFFLACGGNIDGSGPDSGFGGADGMAGAIGTGGSNGVGGTVASGSTFGTGGVPGSGGASGGAPSSSGGVEGVGAFFGVCPAGEWDSEVPLSDGLGCIPWSSSECAPGEQLEQQGTALYDHICVDCDPGTFTDEVNQWECWAHTECSLAEEETAPGTSESDTECSATEPLGFVDRGSFSWATALVATADGLWAAGQNAESGLLLYAISLEGEAEPIYTAPAYAEAASLALLGEDSLVLVGIINPNAEGATAESEVSVRRLSLSGDSIWTRTFSSSESGYEYDVAASVGPNETIYVAGTTYGTLVHPISGDSDVFVRKYEGNGGVAWTQQLDIDPTSDMLQAVVAGPEGNVYLASFRGGGAVGSYLTALDTDGALLWQLESEDIGCVSCTALGVGADGDLYVAGTNPGANAQGYSAADVGLARVSPEGTVEWTSSSPDDGLQTVTSLVVQNETVHVLGGVAWGYGPLDALRIDFDTSGEEIARSVWGGSTSEWVNTAAVSPDGSVYIAGGIEHWRTDSYGADAFVAKWPDP